MLSEPAAVGLKIVGLRPSGGVDAVTGRSSTARFTRCQAVTANVG